MIRAGHTWWAEYLFRIYIHRAFRHHFHAFRLLGNTPAFNPERPLIVLPNHSTWWDGFFFYEINRRFLKRRDYLMMQEEQLKRNRFFRNIGVYGIASESVRGVRESMTYTLDLLSTENESCALCIFPQGELQPSRVQMKFQRGIEWIQKRLTAPCELCTLGLRTAFGKEQRPDVFFKFGPLHTAGAGAVVSITQLEQELGALLNAMDEDITAHRHGTLFFKGKKSIGH